MMNDGLQALSNDPQSLILIEAATKNVYSDWSKTASTLTNLRQWVYQRRRKTLRRCSSQYGYELIRVSICPKRGQRSLARRSGVRGDVEMTVDRTEFRRRRAAGV
jgi:hypothetical protein